MGARIALHAALREPTAFKALVLLGGTRGIASPNDRAIRKRDDDARAIRIDEIGVDAFLDEWLAGPLFTALPDDPVDRAARSTSGAGLASSLRNCGTGTQRFLADELHHLKMPVLLMAGANDEKFVGEAFEMALHLSDAHLAIIPDAGHAAHLERPDFVAKVVTEFLSNY
jgi:2-succinyl-6-hydroxy-2,4-cyclohexadiene-1-carboxylate synthase